MYVVLPSYVQETLNLTHSDSENSKARRMSICDETQALVSGQIPVCDLRDNREPNATFNPQYLHVESTKWLEERLRSVLTKPLAYPQISLVPSVLMSTADTAPQKPTTTDQDNYMHMNACLFCLWGN